ncbi:MAG TPA: DNA polymerase ligase N-terminal domain-containing protein, partial [Patescibacteria group bacterium]|nr:DNA polymerase ligase N-terminal domain-containing protein [Patescibacteria group bacterium]
MAKRSAGNDDLSRYGTLAEYNRKRRFDVTPEPPGRAGKRKPTRALEFVVQKHRASHLHYDFRIEHEGVMLSWAIAKGPSLDPGVRRLAMMTEPHPMDYNDFEGVIPEGEYGGGTVMIWDRGTWEPESPDVNKAL